MHRGQSLYLDLLRLTAALEVFVFHLAGLPNTGVAKGLWNSFGHEAVTVFFVLSGFVIPFSAQSREPRARAFVIARLTRIYSVAIPCLVLTLTFDWIGQMADPALYQGMPFIGSAPYRLAMGAAMLNESWQSVQMLSNTPYWSIAYEFWYYAIFAALFYLRGRTRIAVALAVALIAGPNIILLFPIWGAGWLAFRERATRSWPKWLIRLAFIQPLLVFAAYYLFDLQGFAGRWLEQGLGHEIWWKHLAWSRYLLTDVLLGCSLALNLAAAKHLGPALERVIGLFARPIKWGVARSFTLYLLHQPAILAVTALLPLFVPAELRGPVIAVLTLAIISGVAQATELQRARLKPFIARIVEVICNASNISTRKHEPAHARG